MRKRPILALAIIILSALATLAAAYFISPESIDAAGINGLLSGMANLGILKTFLLSLLIPSLLSTLSFCVLSAAGSVNLAVLGEILAGYFAASRTLALLLPVAGDIAAVSVSLLAGAAAGAIFSLIPVIIKSILNINVTESGLLLSVSALFLSRYLLGNEGAGSAEGAALADSDITAICIAAAAALLFTLTAAMLLKGKTGVKWRVASLGRKESAIKGISFAKALFSSSAVSGALCGLAGGVILLGIGNSVASGATQSSAECSLIALAAAALAAFCPALSTALGLLLSALCFTAGMLLSSEAYGAIHIIIPALALLAFAVLNHCGRRIASGKGAKE
ncbi:MAG: hypothetical protein PHI27_12670 [Eubacteriales bacterium]|nr:hypothetical protein [Eubacteriales bacterium]MDD3883076.1 hypothetical protein [Eubacteriales bacterium]MDD4512601.1 hypothetical protein [Eubacteriales bacterium]